VCHRKANRWTIADHTLRTVISRIQRLNERLALKSTVDHRTECFARRRQHLASLWHLHDFNLTPRPVPPEQFVPRHQWVCADSTVQLRLVRRMRKSYLARDLPVQV
jgi:hypothetical protein